MVIITTTTTMLLFFCRVVVTFGVIRHGARRRPVEGWMDGCDTDLDRQTFLQSCSVASSGLTPPLYLVKCFDVALLHLFGLKETKTRPLGKRRDSSV